MKTLLTKATSLLYFLIFGLLVLGGFSISGPGYKVELAQVSVFAVLLLLLTLVLKRMQVTPPFLDWVTTRIDNLQMGDDPVLRKRAEKFVIVALALLTFAHILRHITLQTHLFDVNYYHQSLFYPFLDGIFHCDVCRVDTLFGEHLNYTLLLLTPITYFVHSDILLFLLKPIFAGIGLWALLKYGPLKDEKKYWALALALFLCSSAFRSSQIWDFREDDSGFMFLCLMMASLSSGRPWLYILSLAGAILTKENYAFSTFFVGFPILLDKDLPLSRTTRKLLATFTFVASLGYFLAAMIIIIPDIMKDVESTNNIIMRFPGLGTTFKEVLLNLVTSPSLWWDVALKYLFGFDSLRYLLLLILPFAFFMFKKPIWLIPAIPGIAMNMLTPYWIQRMQIGHYEFIILPFLFFAMIKGIQHQKPTSSQLTLALLIALCGFGRSPVFEVTRRLVDIYKVSEVMKVKSLDPLVTTAADGNVIAQLSYIRNIRPLLTPTAQELKSDSAVNYERLYAKNAKPFAPGSKRHISEAKTVVLNLEDPWQKFIYDDLYPEHPRNQGEWLVVISTEPSFYARLCAKTTCPPEAK